MGIEKVFEYLILIMGSKYESLLLSRWDISTSTLEFGKLSEMTLCFHTAIRKAMGKEEGGGGRGSVAHL